MAKSAKKIIVKNHPILKTEAVSGEPAAEQGDNVLLTKQPATKTPLVVPAEPTPEPPAEAKPEPPPVEPKKEAKPEPESPEPTEPEKPEKETKEAKEKTPAEKTAADQKAQAEHQAAVQKLVEDKKYILPIKTVEQRKSRRFVIIGLLLSLLLIVAWVDIALDAGLIDLPSVKPVTHFFST